MKLFFDDVKTTMRLEMMRTKSTAMICQELLLHIIAYNLLRALIARNGAAPRRASFKGTVDRLQTLQWVIWLAEDGVPLLRIDRVWRAGKLRHTSLEDAAVDLFTLARCDTILASIWSSFSWMASEIGEVVYAVVPAPETGT